MLDGYRLLLYSSVAGSVLLLIARALTTAMRITSPGRPLAEGFHSFAPIPYLGTGVAALLLGWALSYFLNWFFDAEKARAREIVTHGNSLLQLFHHADVEERMVSITLDNRKWYAGYIAEGPNLEPSERYFKILPIISGYRDKDTLRLIRTVSYEDVFSKPNVDPREFVITLPLGDVKVANLFDPVVYHDHFAPDEPEG